MCAYTESRLSIFNWEKYGIDVACNLRGNNFQTEIKCLVLFFVKLWPSEVGRYFVYKIWLWKSLFQEKERKNDILKILLPSHQFCLFVNWNLVELGIFSNKPEKKAGYRKTIKQNWIKPAFNLENCDCIQ